MAVNTHVYSICNLLFEKYLMYLRKENHHNNCPEIYTNWDTLKEMVIKMAETHGQDMERDRELCKRNRKNKLENICLSQTC